MAKGILVGKSKIPKNPLPNHLLKRLKIHFFEETKIEQKLPPPYLEGGGG
jgi:hypothetical protein